MVTVPINYDYSIDTFFSKKIFCCNRNIIKDAKILSEARQEAFRVVERDPDLAHQENNITKQVLRERWKGRLELASIG